MFTPGNQPPTQLLPFYLRQKKCPRFPVTHQDANLSANICRWGIANEPNSKASQRNTHYFWAGD